MSYCQRDIITIEDKNTKTFYSFVSYLFELLVLLFCYRSTTRNGGAFVVWERGNHGRAKNNILSKVWQTSNAL